MKKQKTLSGRVWLAAILLFSVGIASCKKDGQPDNVSQVNKLTQEYGAKAVSRTDIPKGVTPIKFSTIQQAEQFLASIKSISKSKMGTLFTTDSLYNFGVTKSAIQKSLTNSLLGPKRIVTFEGTSGGGIFSVAGTVKLVYRRYTEGGMYDRETNITFTGPGIGPDGYAINNIVAQSFDGTTTIFGCTGFLYFQLNGNNWSVRKDVQAHGHTEPGTDWGTLEVSLD